MINYENIAIYPVINTETQKPSGIVLKREMLKEGFLEEIVKQAVTTADYCSREFVFTGSSRKISHELLMNLGKTT